MIKSYHNIHCSLLPLNVPLEDTSKITVLSWLLDWLLIIQVTTAADRPRDAVPQAHRVVHRCRWSV